MKRQPNVLTNVLRRSIESATQSGHHENECKAVCLGPMNISVLRLFLLSWALLASIGTGAQEAVPQFSAEKFALLDEFIEESMQALKIPGASVAVTQSGEIVHARNFGIATPEEKPVSELTAFNIGSVSKSFAAVSIGQLVEEGHLELDDLLVKHFPWFRTSDKTRSDQITIRHLLSHTSGLSTTIGNINQHERGRGPDVLEHAVRNLASKSLVAVPGERYVYSNANYQILGALIERITGQPYEDVIDERILQPLGMANSYVVRPTSGDVETADGFRYWFGQAVPYRKQIGRVLAAQQGIYASALDMTVYLHEFLRQKPEIIGAEFRSKMLQPVVEYRDRSYGLGWRISNLDGNRLIYHNGIGQGFTSTAGFVPELGLAYVVLLNANWSFGSRNIVTFTNGVRDILLDREVKPIAILLVHRLLRIVVSVLPLVLCFAIFNYFRRAAAGRITRLGRPLTLSDIVIRLIGPTLLFAAVPIILLRLPLAFGGTLNTAAIYSPDLALLIVISAAIASIWAISRPFLRLRIKAE